MANVILNEFCRVTCKSANKLDFFTQLQLVLLPCLWRTWYFMQIITNAGQTNFLSAELHPKGTHEVSLHTIMRSLFLFQQLSQDFLV